MAKVRTEAPTGARGSFPSLLLVGTDFRSAPLELRERVAYNPETAEDLLIKLLARDEVAEAVVLSTCNRTEIYVVPRNGADSETAYRAVLDLAFLSRAPEMEREGRLRVLRDEEAARHLLAVASGLQSMVLGEPEILGQVKQATDLADTVGSAGPVVRRLMRAAADAGRRSRNETAISAGAVSLGYAVVELARNIYSDLSGVRVLVLGAGETASFCVRNLLERGADDVRVANRSAGAGEEAAGRSSRPSPCCRSTTASTPPPTPTWWSPPPRPASRCSPATSSRRRCRGAAAGRCWWSTSACRATSRRRPGSWTTSSSTPSTRCRR